MTAPSGPDDHRDAIAEFFRAIQDGDYPALLEGLTPDAITRWPQSSERITGAMACVRVYENYPGGPPTVSRRAHQRQWRPVGRRACRRLRHRALAHGQHHRVRGVADRPDDRLLRPRVRPTGLATGAGRHRGRGDLTPGTPAHRDLTSRACGVAADRRARPPRDRTGAGVVARVNRPGASRAR